MRDGYCEMEGWCAGLRGTRDGRRRSTRYEILLIGASVTCSPVSIDDGSDRSGRSNQSNPGGGTAGGRASRPRRRGRASKPSKFKHMSVSQRPTIAPGSLSHSKYPHTPPCPASVTSNINPATRTVYQIILSRTCVHHSRGTLVLRRMTA